MGAGCLKRLLIGRILLPLDADARMLWQISTTCAAWSPVARGNLALIAVDARDAERIEYRPWWLWPALALSLSSLGAAVVAVARGRLES